MGVTHSGIDARKRGRKQERIGIEGGMKLDVLVVSFANALTDQGLLFTVIY